MSYPYVFNDAGRSTSKRPRQKNDCTVRAFALTRGIAYDEAYDILKAAGRKCATSFNFGAWIKDQPFARKISFPAVKGNPRMNPPEFCRNFAKGRYIVRTAKHVFAVIDGFVHDDHVTYDARCIYAAWEINAAER